MGQVVTRTAYLHDAATFICYLGPTNFVLVQKNSSTFHYMCKKLNDVCTLTDFNLNLNYRLDCK